MNQKGGPSPFHGHELSMALDSGPNALKVGKAWLKKQPLELIKGGPLDRKGSIPKRDKGKGIYRCPRS